MVSIEQMLIRDEGLKLKPYKCTSNKLTIGVGRNLEDKGISEAEAIQMLANDVDEFTNALMRDSEVGRVFTKQNGARQNALVNMAFNMGVPRLKKFVNMWAALDAGHYSKAAEEAKDSRWYHQVKSRGDRICDVLRTGTLEAYE